MAKSYLHGKRFKFTPKFPWERRASSSGDYWVRFRAYVGAPSSDEALHPLQHATELALANVEEAAVFVGTVEKVQMECAAARTVLSEGDCGDVARRMQAWIDQAQRILDAGVGKGLAPEVEDWFTLQPPERVWLMGHLYDNAHAAGSRAIASVVEAWNIVARVADDRPDAALELFVAAWGQAKSTPFEELLLQIRREHTKAKHSMSNQPPTGQSNSPMPPHWSAGYSKKELAVLLGDTVRGVIRYMETAGIRFKPESRQSILVDLNTLSAEQRARFDEASSGRAHITATKSRKLAPKSA